MSYCTDCDSDFCLHAQLTDALRQRDAFNLDLVARMDQIVKLEAQLAELRTHLGTLTPGGSHTCITCAAHCVVIKDLEDALADIHECASNEMSGGCYHCEVTAAKALGI